MARRDEVGHQQGRTDDFLFPHRRQAYTPSFIVRWKVSWGLLPKERLVISADELRLLDSLTKQHQLQTKLEDERTLADY